MATRARRGRATCRMLGCTRPAEAGGYCHSHLKRLAQEDRFGNNAPEKPPAGKVLIQGVPLNAKTAKGVQRLAKRQGLSTDDLVTAILEGWARRQSPVRRVQRTAGINLSRATAKAIAGLADQKGVGIRVLISELIERWARRQPPPRLPRDPR